MMKCKKEWERKESDRFGRYNLLSNHMGAWCEKKNTIIVASLQTVTK